MDIIQILSDPQPLEYDELYERYAPANGDSFDVVSCFAMEVAQNASRLTSAQVFAAREKIVTLSLQMLAFHLAENGDDDFVAHDLVVPASRRINPPLDRAA